MSPVLLLAGLAAAASLDNLEVGGPWGSPLATDPTATWWNPAGLAGAGGTRVLAEVAPTFATVRYQRADPHGGLDTVQLAGAVPFVGVASDLGADGVGLGASLAVPIARGGHEVEEPGTGRYALREGMVQALWLNLSAAARPVDPVAFGGTLAVVRSDWLAVVDNDTLPDLDAAIAELGQDAGYTDANLEHPDYAATLVFDPLHDTALSFGAGLRLMPTERVRVGLAYQHGVSLAHQGGVEIRFGCPPQEDVLGRFGAEAYGLCDATVPARATVAYPLPGRFHLGVGWDATEAVTVELFGGWVRWSVFQDYDITIAEADAPTEAAEALVEQHRLWARANEDARFIVADVKGEVGDRLLLGGRVSFDEAAVPDQALSTNNYDANDLILAAMADVWVAGPLRLGLSYSHHLLATREVTTSGFSQTVEGEAPEDRWNYPHANGTYSGRVSRLGIQARAAF